MMSRKWTPAFYGIAWYGLIWIDPIICLDVVVSSHPIEGDTLKVQPRRKGKGPEFLPSLEGYASRRMG